MLPVRRWLRALMRPDRVFAEWRPSFRLAAAAVLLVALVNGAGVAVGAGSVEAAVSGSVPVDNPAYPGELTCERHSDGGMFDDTPGADEIAAECANTSQTVQQPLAPVAGSAARNGAVPAAFATLAEWLLVAAAIGLVVAPRNRGEFTDLLAIAGWGTIPALLRYAARPAFVGRAARSWDHPGTIEALEPAARAFVSGEEATLFAALVVLTLAWQAVIYAYGFAAHADAPFGRIATVAGTAVLALGGLFVAGGPLTPGAQFAAGVGLLVFALPGVAAPYAVTRFGEQLDAIGSTRSWGDIEPAGWNVWVTRAVGTVLLVGAFWLFGGPLFV